MTESPSLSEGFQEGKHTDAPVNPQTAIAMVLDIILNVTELHRPQGRLVLKSSLTMDMVNKPNWYCQLRTREAIQHTYRLQLTLQTTGRSAPYLLPIRNPLAHVLLVQWCPRGFPLTKIDRAWISMKRKSHSASLCPKPGLRLESLHTGTMALLVALPLGLTGMTTPPLLSGCLPGPKYQFHQPFFPLSQQNAKSKVPQIF
ncbi:hypothetical protein BDN72DRAFT_654490 [Pluteus cervinus]|uniref:Uncharacterized protein n=1 Tax=Pluteus cervinus TaxID=181527 RepID=A0ACD3AS25_9AGAR|nr:hypothetical protein BDN72DRAFT_654490 [Pluteus cervinus]